MAEGRNQTSSLMQDFCELEECVKGLGCRLRSGIEEIRRLESNILEYLKDVDNLDQRLLLMEKSIHREKRTISVAEEAEMSSDTGISSSIEGIESNEDTTQLLSTMQLNNSGTERHLKLQKSELLECQPEWKREKEELVQRQAELEGQIRCLQEQLSRLSAGKTTETVRRRKTIQGSEVVLDKTLFPVVVQCFVALRRVSEKRRIESSCLLIQRIFRGYVVRKDLVFQLTKNHRTTNFRIKGSAAEREAFGTEDNRSTTTTTKTTTMIKGTSERTPSSGQEDEGHNRRPVTAEETEQRDEDDDHNNNGAKDVGVVPSTGSDGNRSKPRKTSFPRLLQHGATTKAKHPASSTSSSSSSSSSSQATKRHSWSVSATTEWQDPTDIVVHNHRDLKQLELYFATKIAQLNDNSSGKSSVYDVVFAEALKEFHSGLMSSSATEEEIVGRGYKDLMNSFERELRSRAEQQQQHLSDDSTDRFPYPLFINAFRGFIDAFIKKKQNREIPEIKTRKEQQKTNKSKRNSLNIVGEGVLPNGGCVGGFCQLESCDRLMLIDRLIEAIESKGGLSVVGLYRVAGNAAKIKQLIRDMTTTTTTTVQTGSSSSSSSSSHQIVFAERDLHVMTSVLKTILREMPQPLINSDICEDLLQLPDADDRHQSVDRAIGKLAEQNRTLLSRLVTHLAKVALHESSNRMSANALAIVFVPCLLRSSGEQQSALNESLNLLIQKQTQCLQLIIESELEKMKKVSDSLSTSDTDTISVTESVIGNVRDNDTVNILDDVFEVARITDTCTTDSDSATSGIVSSAEETDSGPHLNVADNAITAYSANGNDNDDTDSIVQQTENTENTLATAAESLIRTDSARDQREGRKETTTIHEEESLSIAGDDLDLDFNVNFEDEDDDPDLNEGQRTRTEADDDLDLKVTSQPNDQSEGQATERVEDTKASLAPHDEETKRIDLGSSEDSSNDLHEESCSPEGHTNRRPSPPPPFSASVGK